MSIHPNNKRVFITLNKDLLAELQKKAEKNNRTVSKEVEHLVKNAYKK